MLELSNHSSSTTKVLLSVSCQGSLRYCEHNFIRSSCWSIPHRRLHETVGSTPSTSGSWDSSTSESSRTSGISNRLLGASIVLLGKVCPSFRNYSASTEICGWVPSGAETTRARHLRKVRQWQIMPQRHTRAGLRISYGRTMTVSGKNYRSMRNLVKFLTIAEKFSYAPDLGISSSRHSERKKELAFMKRVGLEP